MLCVEFERADMNLLMNSSGESEYRYIVLPHISFVRRSLCRR